MTESNMPDRCVDRSGWELGPWDHEPDRIDFVHAGLACFLSRNDFGAWCGYAGVPAEHPLYGVDYNDEAARDLSCHGGLSYSAKCEGYICHRPAPGMTDDVWWFGFDCGHGFDFMPGMHATLRRAGAGGGSRGIYRDAAFARHETEQLAEQLARLESDGR